MAVVSSAQREKLARAGFEAFSASDPRTILAMLAEDVEVLASPELANPGSFHGHDGYLEWIGPWTEVWDDLDFAVTDVIPVGDRHVVADVHQTGHGRAGIEVSMNVAFLFEVRDDELIAFLALLPDREQALALARERETGA
jgi:ketosteroid isomerase-like protein